MIYNLASSAHRKENINMKKIAIISRALHMNGATKALVEMLRRIDYEVVEIDLWVLDFSNMAEAWVAQIPEKVRIREIPRYEIATGIFCKIMRNPIHFVKSIVAGYKLKYEKEMILQWKYTAQRLPVIQEKYDVAISFRHFDIDVFYVIKNIKAQKKYFWVHGVQEISTREIEILNPYYKKYNGVFPVSVTAKKNIENFFPSLKDKCKVAYCVVDAKEIIEKAKKAVELFDKEGIDIIFTIARLGEEKGVDIAIEAAKILMDRNIEFKWYVAGDGNQRKNYENMVEKYGLKDKFILLGNVSNPYGMLKECTIYVQPSRLESYGLAINEAKILKKSIVCSDIAAGREQIVDGETGVLVGLSGEKFADAIQTLLKNKELRENLERNLNGAYSHFEAVDILKSL